MEVVEVNIFKDTDAKSQLSMLDRLWQAECRLERSYSRAQRELQRLQNSRETEPRASASGLPEAQDCPSAQSPAPATASAEAPSTAAPAEVMVGQAFSPVSSAPDVAIPNQHPTSKIQHPPSAVESN